LSTICAKSYQREGRNSVTKALRQFSKNPQYFWLTQKSISTIDPAIYLAVNVFVERGYRPGEKGGLKF